MFTVSVPADEITDALAQAFVTLDDMSPIMNRVAAMLRDQSEDRFAEQKAPDGSPWAPRSAVTLGAYERRAKAATGPASWGGVLHYSGQLSGNLHHSYGPDYAEVGSNEPYAATMQFGAAQGQFGAFIGKDKKGRDHFHSIPWGNIPARPFLGMSDENRTDILNLIADYLETAIQP